MFRITGKVGRAEITLEARKIGEDYLLTLTGGREHAGAVAVGLFDEKSQRASSSVLTLPGHREEELALKGAKLISRATHKPCVFIAGIHLDNISREEIREIVSVSEEMIDKFIASCKKAEKEED